MKPKLFKLTAGMRRAVKRGRTHCCVCDAKKHKGKQWDDVMQMTVVSDMCPKGHEYGLWWRRPTKADIRDLGLVRTS